MLRFKREVVDSPVFVSFYPEFVSKIAKCVNNLGIRDRQSEEWWDVGVLRVWVVWNVDFSMVL